MERSSALKTLALSAVTPHWLLQKPNNRGILSRLKTIFGQADEAESFHSRWHRWPDMEWAGPDYWGNRLQDWQIRQGAVRCSVSSNNRTLHCLTRQISDRKKGFETRISAELANKTNSDNDYIGFRLGAKGKFKDYRSAAVFGEGLDAGLTTGGRLFIGDKKSTKSAPVTKGVRLQCKAIPVADEYEVELRMCNNANDELLNSLKMTGVASKQLTGNIALVSHFGSAKGNNDSVSVRYSDWIIKGERVDRNPDRAYGPICFAQYTLHKQILKMTAQLAPVEAVENHKVHLQIKQGYKWETLQSSKVHPLARTVEFRIEGWKHKQDIPYRIKLELPLQDQVKQFRYEGTIAADPVTADQLKTAVFSCNAQHGFPNSEVVGNAAQHRPDMAVFLGDQFYESHGGFGVQHGPLEKAVLDYLRKWYMFGWSYRELFRHIPSAFIPDDHDVYHGNLWGEAGEDAPVKKKGWGYKSQDEGGYKMPPAWVNVVQRTQTSNLPDPYDPTPVKQGISVYYTDWTYGGISFGILEDRKFKSAPDEVLPFKVTNGFIQDPATIDIADYYDIQAELLGKRQERFLEQWAVDWSGGATMKVVLSQSPFCSVHTLPKGATGDRIVPRRPIPKRGTYPGGDVPAADMDTNGWPQKKRDKALRILRKSFALHVGGDQHLASMVQYGIEEYGDSGFVFTGPALNNVWPRRWWPQIGEGHRPLPGRPKNTGNFRDGFGNRMTVYAAANPVQTNREPAIIYDRATGYGMVTFDKTERTIRIECWPRYVDPASNPEGQYDGWPIVVRQQDNYGRRPVTHLPTLQIEGLTDPVVEIYRQEDDELIYALRIKGQSFTPKIFERIRHKIRVGEPDQGIWKEFEDVSPKDKKPILCTF